MKGCWINRVCVGVGLMECMWGWINGVCVWVLD